MIDMGMGEHHYIHGGTIADPLAVEFKGFLALSLEKTAVKHYAISVDVDDMLGPCHGFCCTMECYSHYIFLLGGAFDLDG